MIVPLVKAPATTPPVEKRKAQRLVPSSGTIYAETISPDGQTQRTSVSDVSLIGAKLIGKFAVDVGDEVGVELHMDSKSAPYHVPAIVVRTEPGAIGVRFTT